MLLNNTNTLDLASWKTIQKSFPSLAAQIEGECKAIADQSQLYRTLSNEQWRQKNVVPSYAISKADAKDQAEISKDLDAASTVILSLTISNGGHTKEKATDNVKEVANTGGPIFRSAISSTATRGN